LKTIIVLLVVLYIEKVTVYFIRAEGKGAYDIEKYSG
jgi:hypothetical protein